MFAIDNH